jgi:hypothetical protein
VTRRNFPGPGRLCGCRVATTSTAECPAIEEAPMNGLIYLVGLIVIIMFILSFLGLR